MKGPFARTTSWPTTASPYPPGMLEMTGFGWAASPATERADTFGVKPDFEGASAVRLQAGPSVVAP
jgi:hypothetical protein